MVVPSRIADINLGIGKPAGKEIRTDFQRARTAQSLDGGNPPFLQSGVLRAEQQPLHAVPECLQTFHRKIGAGLRHSRTRNLRRPYRRQDGQPPRLVQINTDTEIDLFRPFVGLKSLYQAQNRIAGIKFDVLEHIFLLILCFVGWIPDSTASPRPGVLSA